MLSLILAVGGALAYGIADFLGGFASRGTPALRIAAISAPASLAVEIVAAGILGTQWNSDVLWWGTLSGVASAGAFTFLYAALAVGPMTVVAPITAITSAVLPVVVGVLLGELLGAPGVLAMVLGAVAILLITVGRPDGATVSCRGPLVGLMAGVAIAAQLVALSLAPHSSGVAPLLLGRGVSSLILVGALVLRRPAGAGPDRRTVGIALAAGSLDSLANLLFLLASRSGYLSVSAMIIALYPVGTVVLAATVLHERLRARQWAGLAAAAASLALFAAH